MPTEQIVPPLLSVRNGAILHPALPGWAVCVDGQPTTEPDAVPPDLWELAAKLPPPTKADAIDCAIIDRSHPRWTQTICPVAQSRFGLWNTLPNRGRWELAVAYAAGSQPTLVGLWAGQQAAPTLAGALHALYGSEPEPAPKKPEPPKPPAPSPAQKAAERRDRAIYKVAAVLAKTPSPDSAAFQRAEVLLAAIKDFLAGAS